MKRNILLPVLAILISSALSAQKVTTRIDKSMSIYNDVMRQLDINYADTLNYEQMTETAINQMLRQVDPYTVYIPEDKTTNLKFMTTGKYGGIGAIIMQRGDTVWISEPYEGKPAQKNDVRAGDRIIEVDGTNVVGMTTSEVSSLLRGTPKSVVTLKLQRDGLTKPIVRSFEREEVKINPIAYAAALDYNIGFIAFTEFTENSAALFAQTLDDLVDNNHVQSLIIDLRSNGGGLIDEAVKLLGLFVDKGTAVVSTKGKVESSNRTYKTPTTPKYPNMPLLIIVDGNTASAAEIVAGALQDLDRATLIGEKTFGKGLVQTVRPITYNGHLKVTTANYYIPSGRCIQAIDYRNHNKNNKNDGKDSTSHIFYTKKGRVVRDGGGITPDIILQDSSKMNITYSLYTQNLFFDYATLYRSTHDTIALPVNFNITDDILDSFKQFITDKHFQYNSETEKSLAKLIDLAKHEDISNETIDQLIEIKNKLSDNWQEAFNRNQTDIKLMLGREIVQRYYYQQGEYAYFLRFDEQLKRAIEELHKTNHDETL